jgi:hypothetical protein
MSRFLPLFLLLPLSSVLSQILECVTEDTSSSGNGISRLAVNIEPVRWAPGEVTYHLVENTFLTGEDAALASRYLLKAAGAWYDALSPVKDCRINCVRPPIYFSYNLDERVTSAISVIYGGTDYGLCKSGGAKAFAFFPNQSNCYKVVICKVWFDLLRSANPGNAPTTLEHELGHALGFRHELPQPKEPATIPISALDRVSIMSFDPNRSITAQDIASTLWYYTASPQEIANRLQKTFNQYGVGFDECGLDHYSGMKGDIYSSGSSGGR